jgi:hypothetical protein
MLRFLAYNKWDCGYLLTIRPVTLRNGAYWFYRIDRRLPCRAKLKALF